MAKLKLQDLITILNRDVLKSNSCIEMTFVLIMIQNMMTVG